jgi:hypothetical protein
MFCSKTNSFRVHRYTLSCDITARQEYLIREKLHSYLYKKIKLEGIYVDVIGFTPHDTVMGRSSKEFGSSRIQVISSEADHEELTRCVKDFIQRKEFNEK